MSTDQNPNPPRGLSRRRMLAVTGGTAAAAVVGVPALVRGGLPEAAAASVPEYPGADDWVAAGSNALGDTRSSVSAVVIHTTQGSYRGAINHMAGENYAAAHYVVRSSDGHITQMVRENRISWHANGANDYSVGIEHEGWVSEPGQFYTAELYRESAKLVQHLCSGWGIPKDRDHIIAHSEAPGATHTDPGSGWDWDYFMKLVRGQWVPSQPPAPWTAADSGFTTVSTNRTAPPQTAKTVQHLLNEHGASLQVDGIFGSVSAAAVKDFQRANGLYVDGVAGPKTFAVLVVTRKNGHSGDAAQAVQAGLNKYGARLREDGAFGPVTAESVEEFQTANGLYVDGVVGPQTWEWIA
ncbi:hypothetical protein GCM10009676_17760 [Prauserella halophila]|uniref:N-acetylmuramoyl-L-alanine amidase n=2 Tax=Prauserella halophila TaxID=185641 RepID=A0ABN1W797_9PSEU|nr:N-acetyl-anhydromuramyl-L-alanine amidase AmpD [Prauserella halophila]